MTRGRAERAPRARREAPRGSPLLKPKRRPEAPRGTAVRGAEKEPETRRIAPALAPTTAIRRVIESLSSDTRRSWSTPQGHFGRSGKSLGFVYFSVILFLLVYFSNSK